MNKTSAIKRAKSQRGGFKSFSGRPFFSGVGLSNTILNPAVKGRIKPKKTRSSWVLRGRWQKDRTVLEIKKIKKNSQGLKKRARLKMEADVFFFME